MAVYVDISYGDRRQQLATLLEKKRGDGRLRHAGCASSLACLPAEYGNTPGVDSSSEGGDSFQGDPRRPPNGMAAVLFCSSRRRRPNRQVAPYCGQIPGCSLYDETDVAVSYGVSDHHRRNSPFKESLAVLKSPRPTGNVGGEIVERARPSQQRSLATFTPSRRPFRWPTT